MPICIIDQLHCMFTVKMSPGKVSKQNSEVGPCREDGHTLIALLLETSNVVKGAYAGCTAHVLVMAVFRPMLCDVRFVALDIGMQSPYLPAEVLWRQKEQFSDGVGYNWIDGLKVGVGLEGRAVQGRR